jgi:chitinase
VTYATANGTATAGSDYVALGGSVTFPAGSTSQTLNVTVNGDTTVEPNETFLVNLSSPSGATILDGQGVGTITNDDSAALPTLSINDWAVAEGNSGTTAANFTVTLSAAASGTVTVGYSTANGTATAGSDYVAGSGTVTFTAGQITKTIAVVVNGDTTVEPNETFTVNLASPIGATILDAQGIGTITNDDSAPPSGEAVAWTSMVGVSASGGSLTKTTGAGWGNAGAISSKVLPSGDGYVEFTVSETTTHRILGLSNGNTNSNWDDIDFGVYLYAAGPVQIYEKGVLKGAFGTFASGDKLRASVESGVVKYRKNGTLFYTSSAAPTYPLLVDTSLYTQGATFTNTVLSGTWTTTANPQFSINDVSVTEGNAGTKTAIFTVTLAPASASTVTVGYATANGTATAGSDYVTASGTVTFPAGSTSQTVSVTLNGDTTVEGDETFLVNLSSPSGATILDGQGVGTILNDDTSLSAVPVVWTSMVGVSANGGSLTKTTGAGWGNAGAISSKVLPSGDGYGEFTVTETTTHRMLGLSNGNTNANWDDIDFAVYLDASGALKVYEKGVLKGIFATYASGDKLRVSVASGVVTYSKNGTLFYTSIATPTYPLLIDTSLFTQGSTLTNTVISGTWQ